jgi:hypothetical protein
MAEDVDNDTSLDILVTDLTRSPSWFKRTQTAPGTGNLHRNYFNYKHC